MESKTRDDQRIDELERRVARLERRRARPAPASASHLRQLEELKRRRGPRHVRGSLRGAVSYGGAVVSQDREYQWIKELGVPELLDLDPQPIARVAAALANPARLALVRALVEAPRAGQELQLAMGTASAGQLYHHLKELLAAGVVRQAARGRYEVSPERMVPLLALVAAAADLAQPEATPDPESRGEG